MTTLMLMIVRKVPMEMTRKIMMRKMRKERIAR